MSASEKPSTVEEEYFAREDALKRQKLAQENQRQMEAARKEELRKLHHMRCPSCGMELHPIAFRGLEIDQCFGCHGTWLAEGRLEKLAEPEHGLVMKSVLNWFKTGK